MAAKLFCTALATLAISGTLLAADVKSGSKLNSYVNIPLWEDGKVPLAAGDGPLDKPFLTVFAPPENKRNGSAIVIAPGGSNIMLMYGAEGVDVAERFNDWGTTAFVLTYRLSPRYNGNARNLDGRRAMQTVRARVCRIAFRPGSLAALRPARRVMPKATNFAFWNAGGSAKKRSSVGLAPGQPPSM